jgi:hypothetical protein
VTLEEIVKSGHRNQLEEFLESLERGELARTISRLDTDDQRMLLLLPGPSGAADVIEDVPDERAADMIEGLSPGQAASREGIAVATWCGFTTLLAALSSKVLMDVAALRTAMVGHPELLLVFIALIMLISSHFDRRYLAGWNPTTRK